MALRGTASQHDRAARHWFRRSAERLRFAESAISTGSCEAALADLTDAASMMGRASANASYANNVTLQKRVSFLFAKAGQLEAEMARKCLRKGPFLRVGRRK